MSAYRPSTMQAQRSSAMFCLFYDLPFPKVDTFTLLAFVEFLVDSDLGPSTIKNYISTIKSYFSIFNISVHSFQAHQLTLALTSLTQNSPTTVSCKPVLSPHQFKVFLIRSTFLPLSKFYNIAYIFGYLGLLRISNIAPKSSSSFDPFRDITRGDVSRAPSSLLINLRWTKTLQKHKLPKFPYSIFHIQLCVQ
jgi:hypothetical protein